MNSPKFSNPQQERIYRRLKSLVSPGAAAFWRDACRLMEMEPLLESTTHFVGHSLREIESSLRDVLEPIANPIRSNPDLIKCPSCKHKFPKPNQEPTHRDEITAILQALNILDTDDVAQTWLKLPGQNNEYGLHKRAHRNDLAPPRSVDQEFRQFWSKIQVIFDAVLDRFETLYSEVYRLLDELLKKSTPTKDDLKKLRLNVPNSFATRRYFFDRLHSPGWLNKLQEEGFFQNPPEPEVASEGGGIRFLPWPQSRYLATMASLEPEKVLNISLEILETGTKNASVHEDLAEAARSMPPELAARWVEKETEWLKEQDYLYLPDLPEKLGKLIAYLAQRGQVNTALGLARELLAVLPKSQNNDDLALKPRTRCDDYYYEQILTQDVPTLVASAGEATLDLLCNLLNDAINFWQFPHEEVVSDDHSDHWYPTFEENRQYLLYEARVFLTTAVWKTAQQITRNDPARVPCIAEKLESYHWRIFHRIALHLLRSPESPEPVRGNQLWQEGPTSPRSAEELAAMNMAERLAFLEEWQPTGDPFAPSRSGLGMELSKVIAQKPEDFIDEIERFKQLNPEYRCWLLRGLNHALSTHGQRQAFSWLEPVEFCSWMLEQELEIPDGEASLNALDLEWNQICDTVVSLLERGLQSIGENEIPIEFRRQVWTILEQLTEDPRLIPGFETHYRYSNTRPVEASESTVRGKAMHAVLHYGLWVLRNINREENQGEQAAPSFDEMPEVRELLERHLNPEYDSSLTIRSIYGKWLPRLMALDLGWTTQNLEKIFPRDEAFQALRDAAWEGYVTYSDSELFTILREEYNHAVERISATTPKWQNPSSANQALVVRSVHLYCCGELNLGDSDRLLERFFANAPTQNREEFMRQIGERLRYGNFEAGTDLLRRLQRLWEWRISQVDSTEANNSQASELRFFSWWCASRKFDDNWSMTQLINALRLAKALEYDNDLLRYLVTLAPSIPLKTVKCLSLMAEANGIPGDDWFASYRQEDHRAILSAVLQSEDQQARKAAKELINRLLVRGIDFRDLLSDGEV